MYKYMPYHNFDLAALEAWLDGFGQKGLLLTEIQWPFVKLRETDHRIYYRVRYIPENRECKGTVFWGDLYVYSARDPAGLPPPAEREEYAAAAKPCVSMKYWWYVGWIGAAWSLLKQLPAFRGWQSLADPVLFGFAVGLLLLTVIWRLGLKRRAVRYLEAEYPERLQIQPPRLWIYPAVLLGCMAVFPLLWLVIRV